MSLLYRNIVVFLTIAIVSPLVQASCVDWLLQQWAIAFRSPPTLLDAFREEQRLKHPKYDLLEVSGWRAHRSRDPLFCYGNFIYPSQVGQPMPSGRSLSSLKIFYGDSPGFLLQTGGPRTSRSHEYFLLEKGKRKKPSPVPGIRFESTQDAELIARTIIEGFESSLPLPKYTERWKSTLERYKVRALVAFCENTPCGIYAVARTSANYEFGLGLTVVPAYRGRGISKMLVEAMMEQANTRLLAHTDNPASSHVFRSLGFQSLGTAELVEVLDLP